MHSGLKTLALAAATALATGCALTPPPSGTAPASGASTGPSAGSPNQPSRPVQACHPAKAQWAVGKTNTEHNVEQARRQAGAYMVRILRAGQPVTMEHNAERLSLEVDATGRIVAGRCG